MGDIDEKIKESSFFLIKMRESENLILNPEIINKPKNNILGFILNRRKSNTPDVSKIESLTDEYQYYYSAFLCSANSILELIRKTNQSVYDKNLVNDCDLFFIRNIRNINVHHVAQKGEKIRVVNLGTGPAYQSNKFIFNEINWHLLEEHLKKGKCKTDCMDNHITMPNCIKNEFITEKCGRFLDLIKEFVNNKSL